MTPAKHKKSLTYEPRLKGRKTANGSVPTFKELELGAPKRGWLKQVWGKWPGDESIEDLFALLTK